MSKEDIDKAVRDAEKFAEDDKKAKEKVEVKNRAESMIYQCEKSLSDLGDKVTEDEKKPIRDAIDKLKETMKGDDADAIKADTEALEKSFYPLAEKLYAQSGGQPGTDPNAGAGPDQGQSAGGDGTFYSSDFEDKSDK
ncbi:MAG: Hsp70 family protein, partial [Clostridia bacterium]|nr:Hsp70 family protein [Clostridia bacterium]